MITPMHYSHSKSRDPGLYRKWRPTLLENEKLIEAKLQTPLCPSAYAQRMMSNPTRTMLMIWMPTLPWTKPTLSLLQNRDLRLLME